MNHHRKDRVFRTGRRLSLLAAVGDFPTNSLITETDYFLSNPWEINSQPNLAILCGIFKQFPLPGGATVPEAKFMSQGRSET
jgi:hypothetical protein